MDNLFPWVTANSVIVEKIFFTLVILICAFVAIFYANKFIRMILIGVKQRLNMPYSTVILIVRIINVFLWIISCLLLLSFWGISVTGLWTVFVGVATVIGVGFLAVWTMISNVTASLFITFWQPFDLGSTVEILPEGQTGRVVERNMMFTILRQDSGGVLYIPNNIFFQKVFRVLGGKQLYLFEDFENNKYSSIFTKDNLPEK